MKAIYLVGTVWPSSKRFCEGLPSVKFLYLWAKNTGIPCAEVFEAWKRDHLLHDENAIFDGFVLVFKFFSGLTTENGGLTIAMLVYWRVVFILVLLYMCM